MTAIYRSCIPARPQDVPSVVHVHIAAFPGFFLTSLGPAFLRTMYRAFLSNAGGVFVVARANQDVQGFAVGVLESTGKDRALALRYLPQFLISVIPGFIKNPIKVSRRILSQFFAVGEQITIPDDAAVLRSIGILPDARGTGIAGDLLREFERCSFIKGARSVALTTDALDNARAITFYQKNGYEVAQEFMQDKNRRMLLMLKKLDINSFQLRTGSL